MYYVYLLQSRSNPKKTYIGMTENVEDRLRAHNEGRSSHTKKYRPWELVTYVAVRTRKGAAKLEKYFKVGSGHAFARKHLW